MQQRRQDQLKIILIKAFGQKCFGPGLAKMGSACAFVGKDLESAANCAILFRSNAQGLGRGIIERNDAQGFHAAKLSLNDLGEKVSCFVFGQPLCLHHIENPHGFGVYDHG